MKKLIIISIVLLSAIIAKAQTNQGAGISTSFTYTYDANGNRIIREFVINNPPQSPLAPDSLVDIVNNAEIIMPDVSQNNADTAKISDSDNGKPFESALGERKISIYPNPTKGELRVDISNFNPESKGTIYIVDMSGKVVYQNTNITASNVIDISHTARTTYVLRLVIDGKSKEWVVVKQ